MNITYNDKTDLLYVRLDDRKQDIINKQVSEDVVLDIGENDKIIGIEILDASKRVNLEKMPGKQSSKVLECLGKLDEKGDSLLILSKEMLCAYGGKFYNVDSLAIGAINRSMSTIAGFKILVESFNMSCARSLLRLQIDTALRFFAVFLVKEPHDFASKVLNGEQINKIKDSSGRKMTDAYLVSKLAIDYENLENLPVVYKNLSGYIHFSDKHFFDTVTNMDSKGIFQLVINDEKGVNFQESDWIEAINCFNKSIDIFVKYLEGWIITKSNPEKVNQLKRNQA